MELKYFVPLVGSRIDRIFLKCWTAINDGESVPDEIALTLLLSGNLQGYYTIDVDPADYQSPMIQPEETPAPCQLYDWVKKEGKEPWAHGNEMVIAFIKTDTTAHFQPMHGQFIEKVEVLSFSKKFEPCGIRIITAKGYILSLSDTENKVETSTFKMRSTLAAYQEYFRDPLGEMLTYDLLDIVNNGPPTSEQ